MKKLTTYLWATAFLLIFFGCQEEEPELKTIIAPTNLQVTATPVGVSADNPFGDGSGFVDFAITADNAVTYQISINGVIRSTPTGKYSATSDFTQLGVNTYSVTVIALGTGGVSTSMMVDVEVFFDYVAPDELLELLFGDGTKTWRIKSEKGGHFGLGPVGGTIPSEFFGAPAEDKVGVGMYDDRYIFNADGTITHDTDIDTDDGTGTVFGREGLIEELDGVISDLETQGADVLNYPFNDYTVNWTLTAPGGIETLNLTGIGFFGYYIGGNHSYQIVDRSQPNEILIRSTDGNNEFDWWFILTSDEKGDTSNPLETQFTNLVWADEFDVAGAPDPTNWTYDIGNGADGWGNQEVQNYTSDASNVIVEDGNLKITANKIGTTYYFDDIVQADGAGSTTLVIEDFEGDAPVFTDFGGATSVTIPNPDASGINTSANVGQYMKAPDSEVFGGSFIDLVTPLDLSTNNQFKLKVWSPKIGATVRFKIENSAEAASQFIEVDATTTTINQWEELTFDLSSAGLFDYNRVVVFFDFGFTGADAYSSARIKSEGLQEFTYGRVAVSAKMPEGGGTWPAIWMLGGDYLTNPWPAAGEIDILEYVGNTPDVILGTTHDPNNFAGTARTGSVAVPGASTEFHLYEMEWTETEIVFAVDGEIYHTVSNDATLPFNKDFFFILNIAMGGTLGGDIDPAFTSGTMEVEYIRMYQ